MASAIGDLVVRLNADTKRHDRAIMGSASGLLKFGAAGAIAGAASAAVTSAIGTMNAMFWRSVSYVRGLGNAGLEFNGDMRNSLAIMSGVSEDTAGRMREAAFSAAKATGQSASEMAKAYYYLASAGMDAEQSIAALPAVARFATAGNFDLATATDLSTDAQSALGLTSKDAATNLANLTRVTDVLIGANTLANASAQQFSEALTNKAGAAMRSVGMDIEEGISVLAAFADQGVKGSEAGTQFAIVLRDLQTKALENAEAFKQAGVAVFDASGEMRPVSGIIGDIENSLSGMSDAARKARLLELGFSDKSVSSLTTLLGTSGKMAEYEQRVRQMGGITKQVAEKQLGPFEKGWNSIKVSLTKTGAAMMEWAGPILGKAFGSISDVIDKLSELARTSGLLQEWGQFASDAIDSVSSTVDTMLGSWDGFEYGVEHVFEKLKIAAARTWENVSYEFKKRMLSMGGSWFGFVEMLVKGSNLVSGVVSSSILKALDDLKGVLGMLGADTSGNAAMAKLDSQHAARLAQLDQREAALDSRWGGQQRVLPRLSSVAQLTGESIAKSAGASVPEEFISWSGKSIENQWKTRADNRPELPNGGRGFWYTPEMYKDMQTMSPSAQASFIERMMADPEMMIGKRKTKPSSSQEPYELSAAMRFGSKEAYSLLANPTRDRADELRQLVVIGKQQLNEQKRTNQQLGQREPEDDI